MTKETRKNKTRYAHSKHLASLILYSIVLNFLSGCFVSYGTFHWNYVYPGAYRQRAEQLRSDGKSDEAIENYLKHIKQRLADKKRPDDENPYFYYIVIGDIYLKDNRPTDAQTYYQMALENKVHIEFIIDRFRQVAEYYAENDKLDTGIALLRANRDLDPLLFDGDIDRFHKKAVLKEQNQADQSK